MAGGSGPVCSALVNYSTIVKGLMEGKYKKVLLIATGALFSPIMLYQKENISIYCKLSMFGGDIMYFINSFLFCGIICLIAEIILDNTKLTPGHITAMFVCSWGCFRCFFYL